MFGLPPKRKADFLSRKTTISRISLFQPGTHASLLLVRVREPGVNALLQQVGKAFQDNPPEPGPDASVALTRTQASSKTSLKQNT